MWRLRLERTAFFFWAARRCLFAAATAADPKDGSIPRLRSFRQWGKPTEATFRFVEERLRELTPDAAALGPVTTERFYMVGDNPSSDMEGARRANIFHRGKGSNVSWKGVLVRTGVYREGDETNGAAVVVAGVKEAVEWILEQEKLNPDGSSPGGGQKRKR